MKIHDKLIQGTPEWKNQRRGIITASEAADFFIAEKKLDLTVPQIKENLKAMGIDFKGLTKKEDLMDKLPKSTIERLSDYTLTNKLAKARLYSKKLSEQSGAQTLEEYALEKRGYTPETIAMQRGNELEADARALYSLLTGCEVEQVGFIEHDNGRCGASPDGLIRELKKGLEIKCHGPDFHNFYLMNQGEFLAEHINQVQWSLAVSGYESWDLFGYCPMQPSILLTIKRDELTAKYVKAIYELSAGYESAEKRYCEIYEKERIKLAQLKQESAK